MTDFPSQQPWDLGRLRGARHSSLSRAPRSPTPGSPSPPLPDGPSSEFPPGRSFESEAGRILALRLPYPKDHLGMRVPFKCLSVEKLKVERKQFPSRCLTTPTRVLPASGYRVLRAPTPVLCPTRVNPGRPGDAPLPALPGP